MEEARQQRLQKRQTAREEAERERTASDERRIRRKRALRKKQSFRRILVGLIIVVMLGFLCASITGIVMLKKEQHEVLKKQEQLKEEKAKVKGDLKNINDKESIEEHASRTCLRSTPFTCLRAASQRTDMLWMPTIQSVS